MGQYRVYFTDPHWDLYSEFCHSGCMAGDPILVEKPNSSLAYMYRYSLQLQEVVRTDVGWMCQLYGPDQPYISYAACVEAEDRRTILPVLGCMPPWMSATDQCTGLRHNSLAYQKMLPRLRVRVQQGFSFVPYVSPSSCLPPCQQVQVHVTQRRVSSFAYNASWVLGIVERHRISRQTVSPAYSLSNLLVEGASSLGFWLGLSILGLLDLLLQLTRRVRRMAATTFSRRDRLLSKMATDE